jgi:hypothetical protein
LARLPRDLGAECEPSVSYALSLAIDLAALAQALREPKQAKIAGVNVTADGCVLRHLIVQLDAAGWPIIEPIDGPTIFAGSDVLQCYRAARAAARAPLVLLDHEPGKPRKPARVRAEDAAQVLCAVGDPVRNLHALHARN